MFIPSSMGQHKLDVRYGDRNTLPYYNGILDSALLTDPDVVLAICAGRAMSLTSAKKLVPGIMASAGADGGPIPFFAWSGLDANNYPDVQRSRGMPGYYDRPNVAWMVGVGNGFYGIPLSSGLVGAFATIQVSMAGELSTTEFDQTTGATYAPGDPLTVVAADSAEKANRGLLRPVELATDVIVGYVAAAANYTGQDSYPTLAFVPKYTAGTTVPDTTFVND